MLTKLTIRNFKLFKEVEIELGSPVVFIGPNNSGKTTALQALALWDIGLRRWSEKKGKETPKKRPGVTINRLDLMAVPVPNANLLWRGLHTRNVQQRNGKQDTQNIRIDIVVEGITRGELWTCGLEFDYANPQSFHCRPLRESHGANPERMPVPDHAKSTQVAFLPPMSGLADREFSKQAGEIDFLIGQGRTAEVLRNLCSQIVHMEEAEEDWNDVRGRIKELFGVEIDRPQYIAERGEITMTYRDQSGIRLDLSSAGRGLHQTLLLLTYLSVNKGSVLLLDEPDAHLEILRQRQIYDVLSRAARDHGSQIVAASHSEIVLNEAADKDLVIAFVGSPHRISDRGSQALKSLKEIGFDQYYQAEQTGWVFYLEGSTDLAILKGLAECLNHPAKSVLDPVFVRYVANVPVHARNHFYGLREAKKDLVGYALFDKLEQELEVGQGLVERMWNKCEIENYICERDVLVAWARDAALELSEGPLFAANWGATMEKSIHQIEAAMDTLGKSPWAPQTKVSDDFLDPLFKRFFKTVGLPNLMNKKDYHKLTKYVRSDRVDPEVSRVLDQIHEVARSARPAGT